MIRWKGYRHQWTFLGEDKYVNKTLSSTKTIRLIGDGEMGEGVRRWGEREIIYLSLHCYHQNDSCFKMGSDENHFNVSFIVRDNVTRRCPQTTTFEEKGEP